MTPSLTEDAAAYERSVRAANLRALLAEAEAEVNAGKVRPAQEFLEEFERGKKIPGSNCSKGRR